MKRTWTIIGVRDVPVSFKWYQSLFGQPETAPGHDYLGQIRDSDGTVCCVFTSGAFILTKAKGGAAIAAESIDHLRRYIELLFQPAKHKTKETL